MSERYEPTPTWDWYEDAILGRRLKWDRRFLELAFFWARHSKDPSTKVGAVLVGRDPRDVVLAFNGLPPGVRDDPELLFDRERKYARILHAERNALDFAKFDTRGATMYSTLCPCEPCASSIISKGVARVVCPEPVWDSKQASRLRSREACDYLAEAGVQVCFLDPPPVR